MSSGAGLTLTLTIWGVVVAGVGGLVGLREVARYLSLAGGAVAYTLGLWMLSLVPLRLPSGSVRLPSSLAGKSDALAAFVFGLLLGNMGLCCPDPVFLSLIPFLAASSELADGALLAGAYGLGRATPLVAFVVLASSGVDALRLATHYKQRVDRALGWGLVAIGTLILYGYSSVAQAGVLAVLLMIVPVVAYHRMNRSPWSRAGAWLAATLVLTILGLQLVYLVLVYLVLVNLP
jgi:cytochrome c-type biogenesis protein